MAVVPFDIKCYNNLYEKFQNIFEEELINEICYNGRLQSFEADALVTLVFNAGAEALDLKAEKRKILAEKVIQQLRCVAKGSAYVYHKGLE